MGALEGLKAGVGLANPVEVVERACVGPWAWQQLSGGAWGIGGAVGRGGGSGGRKR